MFHTLSKTVSPRNNWSSSMVFMLRATTLLSSFTASSTIKRLAAFLRSKIAVEKSRFVPLLGGTNGRRIHTHKNNVGM